MVVVKCSYSIVENTFNSFLSYILGLLSVVVIDYFISNQSGNGCFSFFSNPIIKIYAPSYHWSLPLTLLLLFLAVKQRVS